MERIVPRPAFTAMIVVAEDPLQSFNVGLPNTTLERKLVLLSIHVELVGVVSEFVALLSKLNLVLVLCHDCIILGVTHFLNLLFHSIFDFLFLFSCLDAAISLKRSFELFFSPLQLLFLSLWLGKS